MQQGHQYANLKSIEGKRLKIEAPIRSKCANECEMKEIKARKAPVGKWLHQIIFS
jgi:hypothetical protein